MKRHLTRCFLSMILLLALTGCGALQKLPFVSAAKIEPCPGLTVGVLIGAEGDSIANEQRDGYELALEQANADGGPAGCKLTLAYLPEVVSGSSNQVYRAVRSLVEEERVVAILGGTSSTASMFAATLVNRFQAPMLIPDSSSMHILPENNFWTFRVGASDALYSQAVFNMINEELGPAKTVAVVFENTTAGHDAAVTAAETATKQEMTLLQYGAIDASQSGYQVIVEGLQASQPDVLYLIFTQPGQALSLVSALAESGYELPMTIVQGPGFSSRAFLQQGDKERDVLINEMLLASSWVGQVPGGAADTFLADFTRFTTQKYGTTRQPTAQSAMAYNSLRILQMAIRQGSATWNATTVKDVAAAREALRADLQAYRENTPAWGNIAFSTGGQNQATVFLREIVVSPSALVPPGKAARRAALP